jgi:hypothetical protein
MLAGLAFMGFLKIFLDCWCERGGTCSRHPEVFLKIMLKLGAPGSK